MDRRCGPMNRNRIEGDAEPGEQANDREALVTKFRWRKSGGRAVKGCVLKIAIPSKAQKHRPIRKNSSRDSSASPGTGSSALQRISDEVWVHIPPTTNASTEQTMQRTDLSEDAKDIQWPI